MPRYFTHYWSKDTFHYYKSIKQKEPINFIASNKFRQRGIATGDEVFVVSIFDGRIWLVGKLAVLGVCDRQEASALVDWPEDDMWDAADYIVASHATSQNYQFSLSGEAVHQLRFLRPSGEVISLPFVSPSRPDNQALRGVRELTPDSAVLLSSLLPPMSEVFLLHSNNIRMEGSEDWVKSADVGLFQILCSICGADFQEKYGMLGRGLLHSSFLEKMRQSAESKSEFGINTEFLCFNCQFMMNCIEPPFTIDRIKRLRYRTTHGDELLEELLNSDITISTGEELE